MECYISTHHKSFHPQTVNILFVIELYNNFESQVPNFIKKLFGLIDQTIWIESKIHNVQLLFIKFKISRLVASWQNF